MAQRKVAVITGAGTGVGAACAEWFARRGWDVLVNYRASASEAEQVATACQALGADAVAAQGDVASDTDCRQIAALAAGRWGRIDALINNAGTTVFAPMSDLEAVGADEFLSIYKVNVVGAFQMARAAAPLMPAGSAIVNISSVAGSNGTGSSYAYAASKGALNTLTLSLARNLAPTIRVNAVLPGMIEGRWQSSMLIPWRCSISRLR
jgi:3-oxoacyl-[acyl-carrier protein] reductase